MNTTIKFGYFTPFKLIYIQLFHPKYKKLPGSIVDFRGPWHRPILYADATIITLAFISLCIVYNFSILLGLCLSIFLSLIILERRWSLDTEIKDATEWLTEAYFKRFKK